MDWLENIVSDYLHVWYNTYEGTKLGRTSLRHDTYGIASIPNPRRRRTERSRHPVLSVCLSEVLKGRLEKSKLKIEALVFTPSY